MTCEVPDCRRCCISIATAGWRVAIRTGTSIVLWYLEQNPDVGASAAEPLLHYLHDGEREGRKPIWCFDCAWYRSAYGLPPDAVALAHFLTMRGTGRVRADGAAMVRPASAAVLQRPRCRVTIRSRTIWTTCCMPKREAFPDLGFVSRVGPHRSQLLSDQRQRRARGRAGSGRTLLPLWLARRTQAEHLFRYTMVSTDQSRRGADGDQSAGALRARGRGGGTAAGAVFRSALVPRDLRHSG